MPKFKLSGAKAVEQKTGFEPYDGPEPTRPGFYRSIVKVMKHGTNNSGSEGFAITLELEAAPGDPKNHAQFDGMPLFSRSIITSSADGDALKEGAQRNLDNLLAALGTKDEPEVILADGEGKVDVKKIGGKNPIGAVVNTEIGFEVYEGARRPTVAGIYKYKESDAPTGDGRPAILDDEEEDESDLLDEPEDAEDADGEADEYDARAEELDGLGIPALKKIAKELEIGVSGTKPKLIERILEAEFAEEEEAEDEEPEDETEEVEEADDEAEDDEEEPDDEEEEEDEDEAAKAERVEELSSVNRVDLKKILKEIAADFTVLKRHSDDDLREKIVAVEFDEDLPF